MPKRRPPLSLDRALQLHAAALAILGALFVGLRPEGALFPALTVVAAVAAFVLTDVWGWFKLNRWVANVIAIAAVMWSLRQFIQIASEEKLIAIADMLCCLQIVLLFQEKNARVFWQLLVLSVLQLVVAAALDLGPQFGLLVTLYGLTAVSMLILLTIYREAHRQPDVRPISQASPPPREAWRLLLARPEVAAAAPTDDQLRRQLTGGLVVRQTMLLAVLTLLFATVFFYATPRLRDSGWKDSRQDRIGRTGFRPEVVLTNGGRIHLSNQVVMRVKLSKVVDHKVISLVGDPYFHGANLIDYDTDERGSRWAAWRAPGFMSGEQRGSDPFSLPAFFAPEEALVRQDIVLEATTSSRRFAIAPTQPYGDFPYGISLQGGMQTFGIPRQRRYSAVTPAIQGRRQVRVIPNFNRLLTPEDRVAFDLTAEHALRIDRQRFPRLIATAEKYLQQQQLTTASSLDKALALERHFIAPEAYFYSLNLDFERDLDLDPIEDFVANHRKGHCEYFASALVMMLRSQGIPARLVLGYKGGSYNSVGQYYVVQQRHAHAWVEALIPPAEVPRFELAGMPSAGGGWYRLDPTPGYESLIAQNDGGVGNRITEAFDYVEMMWRDYVLNLNSSRQDDMVFEPLSAQAAQVPSWVDGGRLSARVNRFMRKLGFDLRSKRPGVVSRLIEMNLAAVMIAGLTMLAATIWVSRLAGQAIARRWQRRQPARGQTPPAFYDRLERLLARLPVVRGAGQTPRELAVAASSQLAATREIGAAAAIPPQIVAAYYRVRFGGAHLDKDESAAIEQALAQLSETIHQRP